MRKREREREETENLSAGYCLAMANCLKQMLRRLRVLRIAISWFFQAGLWRISYTTLLGNGLQEGLDTKYLYYRKVQWTAF